jgi:hypothetical protein
LKERKVLVVTAKNWIIMRENPPRMKNHRKSLPEIFLKKLPQMT